MKRILSVLLATTLAVTSVIPSFAVTYERDESFENAKAVAERCNDFYAQSNNNYVVENGFIFDVDTQTIVQFDRNLYLETLIDKILDGKTEVFSSLRDIEKLNTVVIPEKIAGKNVRFIGNSAFEDADFTQVVIPKCVEKIGDFAFYGCPVTNVVLNEGLLEIGQNAFEPEDGYSIVVPSSVRYIDFHEKSSFILKNPDTKVNCNGTVTVDVSAPLATEKYEESTGTLTSKDLWCQHTEKNGFTYGYDLYEPFSCNLCGAFFPNEDWCPFCKKKISKEDGTCLDHPSKMEQHRLFESKHNGMDLREYVIAQLKTAGLIIDEYTAIATDEEINTYLDENVPENTFTKQYINGARRCFSWKDGTIETSQVRTIVSYDDSLDETPEEITFSVKDECLASTNVFDNLEKVQTVNLEVENIQSWASNHCAFDFDTGLRLGENGYIPPKILPIIALELLGSWGSCKLFNGCEKIKTINILDSAKEETNKTEADILLDKAMKSDTIVLFLKRLLNTDFDNLMLPDEYEYVDGVIYRNNRRQLVAVLKDMGTYEMPSTVTTVNNFAFSEITVKNVIWSENCKYIPSACFIRSNIQNIDLKNVTEIRDLAFYETNIKTLSLPQTLTTLGTLVFAKSQIESIDFPKSLSQSGYSLFSGCLKLNTVTLNSNIQVKLKDYDMLFGTAAETEIYFSLKSYDELVDDIDESLLGFVPNLSNLRLGADVTELNVPSHYVGYEESFSINYVGYYIPKLVNISVDESNPAFCVYEGFLLKKTQDSGSTLFEGDVVLAPNGKNFFNANDVPLWLFNSRRYIKPINSAVASVKDFYVAQIDVNHLYMADNKVFSDYFGKSSLIPYLSIPNYLHSNNIDLSYLPKSDIPDTLSLVNNETKEVSVNTEDDAQTEISIQNVTDKIYKIPCWTELTKEDVFYNGIFCEYFGEEEYISISPDLIGNRAFSLSHVGNYGSSGGETAYADNTVKALRISGDMDLQENDFWEYTNTYMMFADAYDLEITPKTAKSLFKDNAEMQAQIDKYTWNDGYLHFRNGFQYPILQCENPTSEILYDFTFNFFFPWYMMIKGDSSELKFSESDAEHLLNFQLDKKLTIVDEDGILIEDITYEDAYFDWWVMLNYNTAKQNMADVLARNNITDFVEFKNWYIANYVFFDEETKTLETILSVDGETFGKFYPSHINGIAVENISLVPVVMSEVFGLNGSEYMYIPSTIKNVGYVSPNASEYFKKIFLQMLMSQSGATSLEELNALLLEDAGYEYSATVLDFSSNLSNCFGGYGSYAEDIYISPKNEHFEKLVTTSSVEILSKDGKTCYLAGGYNGYSDIYLSGRASVYAPASLCELIGSFSGRYVDVIGTPSEFQSGSYTVNTGFDGLRCSSCEAVLSKNRSSCPICGSTQLTEYTESYPMLMEYGATWTQESEESKRMSKVICCSDNSSFLTHCKNEHDGASCCTFVDPTSNRIDKQIYEEVLATYQEYLNSKDLTLPPTLPPKTDTYNLRTDGSGLSYNDGEIFEKQIFILSAPDRYRNSGYVIVEPFQMSKEVNLELKKGTVNFSVYDLDNEEYYTGKTDFDVYNADDNTLFTEISMTDGSASSVIPYGEYYIVPHSIPGYAFEVERLPLSITEDGQIVNLSFNILAQPSYTLLVPEFLQATKAGEATVNGEVSIQNVVLPKTKSLDVKVAYSGELRNTYQESKTISYVLCNDDDTVVANNSSILNVSYGTSRASIPIHAQITDEVKYAGVYIDIATFTVDVI